MTDKDLAVENLQDTDAHLFFPSIIPTCGLQFPKPTLKCVGKYFIYNNTFRAQAVDSTGSHSIALLACK